MIGTFVNTGAVVLGAGLGILVRSRVNERMTGIVFQAIGLITLVLGFSMAFKTENMLLVMIAVFGGALLGQWIGIDNYIIRFSRFLQRKSRRLTRPEHEEATFETMTAGTASAGSGSSDKFTEGFVTATMIFCIGSMSILGSIEDGLGHTPTLLYAKSIMDCTSAVILAASFGMGVMFSTIPLFIYQGGLTLLTAYLTRFLSETMIADVTGTGGILLIGLGITMLKIKNINIINMLPALVFILLLSYYFG